jgi:hypothetical protein
MYIRKEQDGRHRLEKLVKTCHELAFTEEVMLRYVELVITRNL